ncbi:MAG TPA: cupin domain-containing protein [Solirubrobacteraceae bacterium]|nr:cupin domain-containing protein [Solirubrobacteraceae bacterium]
MANFTRINLVEDVEDMAARFGYDAESRFAREPLGLEKSGLSLFRLKPHFRFPFGHSHSEQEEVYVLLQGTARIKVEDEVVDLRPYDAVRVAPGARRGLEAGPEAAELLAFGAPNTENQDAEMLPGWWSEGT